MSTTQNIVNTLIGCNKDEIHAKLESLKAKAKIWLVKYIQAPPSLISIIPFFLPLFVCVCVCGGGGALCWSLFLYALLCVLSSFAIILTRESDGWLPCFNCLSGVVLLFLLCGPSSRCCGLVCSVWMWYFLIIHIGTNPHATELVFLSPLLTNRMELFRT